MRASESLTATSLIVAALLTGCSREPAEKPAEATAPADAVQVAAEWPAFVESFIEARFNADPHFAVQAGRHEFDGKMPDLSRAAIDREVSDLRRFAAELGKRNPASLTAAQRFEHEFLQWVVDTQLFWLTEADAPFRNPAWYMEKLDPSMYLTREYAPLPKRLEGFLGYARAVPALAANIRANLRTPLPKAFIDRGTAGFGGYATFFRSEMPAIFAQVADEELKRDLTEATAAAATSMDELTAWLESQRATATDDFALGAPLFLAMLRQTERVDIPLEELELVGRKDLERNLAALKDACAAFAPKASLAACVDRMRANKPSGGSVEGARAQLEDLRQFVIDKKLVSIPGREQALVAESPPYNRGNFAYISIPGPYESPAVKVTYYVAPPDAKWSAAERTAYLPGKAYLLFVSAHEVWPGHYLQSQFMNANPSRAEALWWNYSFGEGWAHYAEEMMYDAGLGAGQPEMRVGMLINALMRNVRFLSAICLHSGCMSLEESEKMFRDSAFTDAGNARQQALRGTYDPGYLAYTLGKLMIRKLRADWLAANPSATPQQFHDKFLSFGAPPVPLVRKEMLGSTGAVL
ncbi:MAG TPA: DUF885 domain-containing protein [Steroidobacteraceae bacterium]|nr:DUF885 domain-containing protein [Steroidobacteraceae bacterium]